MISRKDVYLYSSFLGRIRNPDYYLRYMIHLFFSGSGQETFIEVIVEHFSVVSCPCCTSICFIELVVSELYPLNSNRKCGFHLTINSNQVINL